MNTLPEASTSASLELLLGFECNAIFRSHFHTIDFLRRKVYLKIIICFYFPFYLWRRGQNVYWSIIDIIILYLENLLSKFMATKKSSFEPKGYSVDSLVIFRRMVFDIATYFSFGKLVKFTISITMYFLFFYLFIEAFKTSVM